MASTTSKETSVNILVSNYTNKHITFNKGEYVGHLEPPIGEIPQSPANPDSPTTHYITMERIMAEKVKPDTFRPPHHKQKQNMEIRKLPSWVKGLSHTWSAKDLVCQI